MKFSRRINLYLRSTPFKKIPKDVLFIIFPNISWRVNKWLWQKRIYRLKRKNKEFILEIRFGGLGDHLVFSAIPEILAEKGVKFLLSDHSVFFSKETKNIVWSNNPNVQFTKSHGIDLSCPRITKYKNYNDALADIFNARKDAIKIKIPYSPRMLPIGKDDILCDLTFGPSGEHNGYTDKTFINNVIQYLKDNFKEKNLVILQAEASYINTPIIDAIKTSDLRFRIQLVKDTFELADFLYSYPERVLLYSGAASLAAAINCKATVLCNILSNPYFQYDIHDYVFLRGKN